MKLLLSILSIFICTQISFTQTASEALRYSLNRPAGTARALACNNAIGALGGDFTAIAINPAGIGLFRKSDVYVSIGPVFQNIESQLATEKNGIYSKTKESFQFHGAGIVFTGEPIASKWSNVNFAINFIKTADFNENSYFKGKSIGSISDRFLELALDPNQTGLIGLEPNQLDNFEAGLAYETGVIYDPGTDPNHTTYTTDLRLYPGYLLPKEQITKITGGLYDFSLGLGGNFNEKIAVGANLNIPFGEFNRESTYNEYEAKKDEVLPFINLEFKETLKTKVSGINARLGLIYKPVHFLRLGIAWQTPSYLWLTDQFNTQLSNTYYNNRRDTSLTAYSPDGEFTYRLTTPSHTVLSIAGVSKMGFISLDIDFMNPQNAHYNLTADSDNAGDYEFQEELNKDIEKQFKSIIQYRLGAEFVIQKFRIRGGYEILGQAYANTDKFDSAYSYGFGYRADRWYLDLAYKNAKIEQSYAPYLTGNSDFDGNGTIDAPTPLVNQKNIQQRIQITLGFKL
ncbi:MAG: hypothetical protein IPG12_10410 [Saprospiraceae bacterium]|nr:hypothetical protein [Saprospiraceae bacterium]